MRAAHHGITGETLILCGIGYDHHFVLLDSVTAKGDVPRQIGNAKAILGLEPLSLGVNAAFDSLLRDLKCAGARRASQ